MSTSGMSRKGLGDKTKVSSASNASDADVKKGPPEAKKRAKEINHTWPSLSFVIGGVERFELPIWEILTSMP